MADQSVAQNANELRDAALGLAEKAAELADSLANGASDAASTATVAVQGSVSARLFLV